MTDQGQARPIPIAQIGAGRMGSLHASNAAESPRFALVAIADHNESAAQSLADATGAGTMTVAEMLADEQIEGVIVASSTDAHLDHVRQALSAGKAVFCEKPLDLSLDRLDKSSAWFADPGLPPLFVAFNRRFDPHYRALAQRAAGGEIGTIETLHIVNHDPAPPAIEFIPGSGGLFKDFTIHDFDLCAWLLQEPVAEVFAASSCLIDPRIAEHGDADSAKLVLRTASGKLCTISNSRRSGYGYDQRIEMFGSKGALRVDNVHRTAIRRFGEEDSLSDAIPYSFHERYVEAYRAELDHFADIITKGATPATGFAASRAALALAEAADQSVRQGRPVTVTAGE